MRKGVETNNIPHLDYRKPNVALIGPYPYPYGGISVHVQRFKELLENEGYACTVYDLGYDGFPLADDIKKIKHRGLWLLKFFFWAKEEIIHFHYSNWRLRIILCLMSLMGKKIIVTIHGESFTNSLKKGSFLRRYIIIVSLKLCKKIIAVNNHIKEIAVIHGIKEEMIVVIPAFLPPVVRENNFNEIPEGVWQFIRRHDPIVSANAYKISFYNNVDLYGIDMCIDLCEKLKRLYPKIGFIFCLPNIGNEKYYKLLLKRIFDKNIDENYLFIRKEYSLYPIIMCSDIFVRPTNTDGDSISIREALYFGIPVVTSDVVERPEGCIVFKNRDNDDFYKKTLLTLSKIGGIKNHNIIHIHDDNYEKIIRIYNDIIKNQGCK